MSIELHLSLIHSNKALEKEEIVVQEILSGECDITVYANGYVLYRENGKKTIFPLHSCKDYPVSYTHLDVYKRQMEKCYI